MYRNCSVLDAAIWPHHFIRETSVQNNQTKDDDLSDILAEINMPENEGIETIHLYIYKEEPKKNTNVVDADTANEKTHPFGLIVALFISSLLPIFSIAFQIFILLNPPIATITLFPIHKELSVKMSIPVVPSDPNSSQILGHLLKPVIITESKIELATGRGHQDASFARGTITFYNGSFTSVSVPQGLQLTGKSGVSVVTDNSAIIPPALPTTPPTFGKVSVSAHAVVAGSDGNIPVNDINTNLNVSLLAQNTNAFHGGADARDYSEVTQADIDTALSSLEVQVTQSVQAHLLGEVQEGQALIPPICKTNFSSDHQAGDEASKLKVIFKQSCMGAAYDMASLQEIGSEILMSFAQKSLGTSYFPTLGVHVHVLNAAMKGGSQNRGVVTVLINGVWFYRFSENEKDKISRTVSGMRLDNAIQKLKEFPGVSDAKITFQGFGDEYYLPKDTKYIRTTAVYSLAYLESHTTAF